MQIESFQRNFQSHNSIRDSKDFLDYGDFPSFETMEFVPGWTSMYIDNAIELDMMTSMKGLESLSFLECLDLASIAVFEDIKVPFLHINQLIANKKAVNRPKDQIDVIELEKIREFRDHKQLCFLIDIT